MSNWLAIWGLKDVLLINNLLYTFHSKIDLIFLSDMSFQTWVTATLFNSITLSNH